MSTTPSTGMTLDERMAILWRNKLDSLWGTRTIVTRNEQGLLLQQLVATAPPTRWGKPAPEKVEAMVQVLTQTSTALVPAQVAVRGRFEVPGLESLDQRVKVAVGTLIVGEQHYDLNDDQTARLKALGERWQQEEARHRARSPDAAEQAELDAMRERFQLQEEMAALPTVPDPRRRRRRGASRRRSGGDGGLGAAIGSNSFGSWG